MSSQGSDKSTSFPNFKLDETIQQYNWKNEAIDGDQDAVQDVDQDVDQDESQDERQDESQDESHDEEI